MKNVKLNREQLGDPGKRLNVEEVRSLLQAKNVKTKFGEVIKNDIAKRIDTAMPMVQRLLQTDDSNRLSIVAEQGHARVYHRTMFERQRTQTNSSKDISETQDKVLLNCTSVIGWMHLKDGRSDSQTQ